MYYLIFAQFGIMLQWTNTDGELLGNFFENFKNWDINAGFELFVFVFFLKSIVVLFPIIYKSNKCFIISISNSSNVLKISPQKKKKKYPTSYNKINVNKCFLKIANNS